jgi:hypothetical protein
MACLGLTQETKASREAIEVIEPSGGVVEDQRPPPAIPAPFLTRRFFPLLKRI